MKKPVTLAIAVLTIVAAMIVAVDRYSTRPATGLAKPTSATEISRCSQLETKAPLAQSAAEQTGTSSRETVPAASTKKIPAVRSDERRLSRADLAQVLPAAVAPIPDWRSFAPTKLTVVPVAGLPLDFTARSVTNDGKRTTWIGTNETQGATLVACATETLWDAIITIPGAEEYSIQITPDHVRVFEQGHSGDACGQIEGLSQALLATSAVSGSPSAAVSAATTIYTSDLLVLYDAGTKADWGSAAETENRIVAVVTAMNTYLEQSRVDNLRWKLVGTAEAPTYPTTGKLEDDLDRMHNASTELGRFVAQQRTLYGADQVQLIVAGTRDYAGVAYTPGYLSTVNHPGTAATAAHELAHNFGCRHDRQTQTDAADNDGKYYYGHRFTYNSQDTGTIMSYAPYLVPYFSNPDISYQGIPVGIAAGQPRAADNARYLREHADDVANLVPSKTITTPVITTQPTSVTVTSGTSFTLSVVATGNALSYQWAHDGTDIVGATLASYAKTTSTSGDAGTYTVLVRNTAGNVRSNSVTVTVNAAPVTPTTTIPASSSGGGGGAIDLIGALAVLALLGSSRRR